MLPELDLLGLAFHGSDTSAAQRPALAHRAAGRRYSRPLQRLQPGDRIVAYQKQAGYVGYGAVTAPAVMAKDFQTENGPLLDQPLVQPGLARSRDEPQLAEHVVAVDWISTVPVADAKRFDGMFANRNIVCKLRNPKTLEFLRAELGVDLL